MGSALTVNDFWEMVLYLDWNSWISILLMSSSFFAEIRVSVWYDFKWEKLPVSPKISIRRISANPWLTLISAHKDKYIASEQVGWRVETSCKVERSLKMVKNNSCKNSNANRGCRYLFDLFTREPRNKDAGSLFVALKLWTTSILLLQQGDPGHKKN